MISTSIQFMQIEPTTRCNYTCGYCVGRHLEQQDLSLDTYKSVINATTDLKYIQLQGEGEPLLHPNFFDMVAYARNKYPDIKISTTTNGSMFTKDVISKLESAQLTSIFISIESTDDFEFQQIRGGKLSRVKRGILDLMKSKNTAKVGFAVTVLKQTISQLPAIARLYEELGMNGGISVQALQSQDLFTNVYDTFMLSNILSTEDHTIADNIIATDLQFTKYQMVRDTNDDFHSELYRTDHGTCPWLVKAFYLSAGGFIESCCRVKYRETSSHSEFDDNMARMLTERNDIREIFSRGDLPKQCEGCYTAKTVIDYVKRQST